MAERRGPRAPRRTVAGLAIVATVLALVTVLIGVRSRHRPTVLMVGDSLLFAASDDVRADLEGVAGFGAWEVKIGAFPGLKIDDLYDKALLGLRNNDVKAMVIVAGTNNALDGIQTDDVYQVRRMLFIVRSVPCVKWISLTPSTDQKAFNASGTKMNQILRRELAGHHNVELIDFASPVARHHEWLKPGDIHFTPEGQGKMAATIADAVRRCSR